MRCPGDLLLISSYELGHQPLSLASPLGFLSRAGYEATGLDAAVERLPEPLLTRARFVGIAVPMHTAMRLGLRVAERVRAVNPAAHLCFYGLYASLNAGYLLQHVADSVIGGEYEQPLVDLIRALDAGDSRPVDGVTDRQHRSVPVLRRLSFTRPDRHRLPELKCYAHLDTGEKKVMAGYVEASRGCRHTCLHCPITPVYRGRFFIVPAEVVLDDIRHLISLGARHITFGDPDFLNGPGHALRLARALHRAFPDVTFDITTKVEHIIEHAGLFPELKSLGCAFVVSAIESVSDLVLERLEKGHDRADIVRALDILDDAGIPMRPSLVAFTPWTTIDDYLTMLEFIETRCLIDHIDPVQYTIRLLVPPGSALLDRPETLTWLGPLDEAAFFYRWDHPDSRMDALHRRVSRLVEDAVRANEDPAVTFSWIKSLADATAGVSPLASLSPVSLTRRRIPRLTESWFC